MRRLLIRLSDDQIWLDGVTNEWLSTSNMMTGNCNCIPTRKIFSTHIITITDISILVFPGSQTEKAEKPFPHLNPNDKMTAAPDVLPSPWASLTELNYLQTFLNGHLDLTHQVVIQEKPIQFVLHLFPAARTSLGLHINSVSR